MNFYVHAKIGNERRSMTENGLHRNRPELLTPPMDRLGPFINVEERGASITGFLDILGEHRELFLGIFFSVLALGAAYIFGSPKKYASTMELLVTNERSIQAISPGKTESTGAVQEVTEEKLNSEAEVLKSADVLDGVVDPGWSEAPKARSVDEVARHERAVGALRKELQVTPVRKSYLLAVQLTTTDPYQSTQQLSKLLDSFLDEKRRLIQPAGLWQMFAQQADQYKQQWQEAQQQLSEFQQQQGLVTIADQEELLQKQVLSISTELQSSDADIAFTKDKIHGDMSQINATPQRIVTRKTEIPDTGSVDQLHTQLNELEQRRTELLTKYRSDDRLVQQVESEIRQAQGSLDKTLNYRAQETSSDLNPTWQVAQQDLSENNARIGALGGRQKALQAELDGINQKLKTVEEKAGTYNALQHKVAELDQNYQLYLQKRDEAQMAEVMNEHQVLNVAVAQKPTFSAIPVSPRPLRDGVLTVGTGFMLASFIVFLYHNSRRPPSRVLELETVPRYPILMDVPSPLDEAISGANVPVRTHIGT
jgi:uncharacterized protein involved in exopolysaccharide biosynthesis